VKTIKVKIDFPKKRIRKFKDFSDVIWLDDPRKYVYVREGTYLCCSPNYKPIKKRDKEKLIGYTKPKYISGRLYKGTFWWLKEYDLGMPKEEEGYKNYKIKGKQVVPNEAVKFI